MAVSTGLFVRWPWHVPFIFTLVFAFMFTFYLSYKQGIGMVYYYDQMFVHQNTIPIEHLLQKVTAAILWP